MLEECRSGAALPHLLLAMVLHRPGSQQSTFGLAGTGGSIISPDEKWLALPACSTSSFVLLSVARYLVAWK